MLAVVRVGGGRLVIPAAFVAHRGVILAVVAAVLAAAWFVVLRCSCRRRRTAPVVTAVASLAFVAALTTPW